MKITLKDVDLPELGTMIEKAINQAVLETVRLKMAEMFPDGKDLQVRIDAALQQSVSKVVSNDVANYLATRMDSAVRSLLETELGANWRQRGALPNIIAAEVAKQLAAAREAGQ